jgi:CRISPR-associated endonuclease/helicase Cas3
MSGDVKLAGTRQAYYRYWGKAAKEEDGVTVCHLLPYHSLDVAAVGQALLEQHPRLRQQLAILAGLDEVSFSRWMVFFLALHDLGKFADSFQNLCPDLLAQLQHRTSRRGYKERHDTLGFILWNQHIRGVLHNLGLLTGSGQSRRRQPDVVAVDFWVRAVTGHHGQPPKMIDTIFRDFFEDPQDVDAATGFITEVAGLLLPEGEVFPSLDVGRMKTASWWLAGFTVLCDWLGSGREASSFRTEPIDVRSYWQSIQEWAAAAVQKTGLLSAEPSKTFLLDDCFPAIAGGMIKPTPLQAQATQLPIGNGPQLFILEDVTGAGKTEAAVLLAHRLMQAGLAAGLYFGLPTMATSNAMYQRIGSIYRRLFAADAEPSLVLSHSARDLSDAFRLSVVDNEGEYQDGALSAAAHCNAWLADNRKKALLAAVGVGTIDQALLAVLPSRHQSLRLLGLLGKVLIVDEVHACDAYMHTLLRGLLSAHAAAGGSAILLSATLPRSQREGLVKAFSCGLNSQAVDAECVGSEAYPLLTHLHDGSVDELAVQTRDSVRRWVNVQTTDSEEEVAVIIRDAVKQGRCVCWIRNTVRDARKAWSRLVEQLPESHIELFHARYAMSDRLEIEKRVLKHFGPDSVPSERQGRVLVATQVVEQSLDLDFDVLISDLAPIDLVIQRAGRLHRHRRDGQGRRTDGPDERSNPVLYLYTPPWTDLPGTRWLRDALPGTAAVYREMDGQLWLGLHLLREAGGFRMPENARYLIESVYGEDALVEIPEALQEVALAKEGDRMGQSSQAKLNLLNIELGYQQEESNIWWDEAVTPTRLGEESVTVYLARYQNGALVPWVDGGRYAWTRSAVSVRKALIAGEGNSADIPQELLDTTRELLPAKGKWGVLLPMIPQTGSKTWLGSANNASGDECRIYYEREVGLMMENEWREMEGRG